MSVHERSALIIAGGSHGHDFAATAQALVEVLEQHHIAADVFDQPDDAWTAMTTRETPYGMLLVNGLRFRMTHARYDSLREQWGYRTPAAADAALDRHLAAGSSVFSVHTGCICFDDWDRWSTLLGRKWSWDEQQLSWHPERGPLTIEPEAGYGAAFDIVDEVYTDMIQTDAIEVRARCAGQPVMWTRREGASRIGVTTVGHGVDTYEHPAYRAMLDNLIDWLAASN